MVHRKRAEPVEIAFAFVLPTATIGKDPDHLETNDSAVVLHNL
jgi:hypothetical protein